MWKEWRGCHFQWDQTRRLTIADTASRPESRVTLGCINMKCQIIDSWEFTPLRLKHCKSHRVAEDSKGFLSRLAAGERPKLKVSNSCCDYPLRRTGKQQTSDVSIDEKVQLSRSVQTMYLIRHGKAACCKRGKSQLVVCIVNP